MSYVDIPKGATFSVVETTSPEIPTVEHLNSFMLLPKGWHFGTGQPPSASAVAAAIAVLVAMRKAGADEFEVFPDPDGGVLVSGHSGDETMQVLCYAEGNFDFTFEFKDGEEQADSDLTLAQALQRIRKRAWKTGKSYASSTRGTTASEKAVLNVSRLKIRPTTEEYPLLMPNASKRQARTYVNTSADIMASQSLEIRRSSGDLGYRPLVQVPA